jgi:ureidoglycolate lyase
MPSKIPSPGRQVPVERLTSASFAPFGSVVQNPALSGDSREVVTANQGSAKKYHDISDLNGFYYLAPSRKPARPSMSMFVCSPRKLRQHRGAQLFDVKILERHPFTTQTFIPLGLSPNDASVRYLVIVAPTLPLSQSRKDSLAKEKPYPTPDPKPKRSLFDVFSRARPSPFDNTKAPPPQRVPENPKRKLPKGTGLPDLANLRAFIATGDQAVTYGAGTWHAPMVVLGDRAVDFVVVQFVNGVGLEDCQEVEIVSRGDGSDELAVSLESNGTTQQAEKARL